MIRQAHVVGVVVAFCIRLAAAQPDPGPAQPDAGPAQPGAESAQPGSGSAQPTAGKVDARALLQSGIKLLEAKDYLGALAIFRDAYARFPSAKILLNIGTTQLLLDRKVDAANSYQKYLDSSDADPAKKPNVMQKLAELDKTAGVLAISVSPADAEIQINNEEWIAVHSSKTWRVAPGAYTVRARKSGFQPGDRTGVAQTGATASVSIVLLAVPEPEVRAPLPLPASVEDESRSRYGGIVLSHISVAPKIGSAVLVGGTADVTKQISVDAAVILGPGIVSKSGSTSLPPPKFGLYAGGHYAFQTGKIRPRATLGLPVFFDAGARLAIRAGGGLEYVVSKHIALIAELAGELEVNPRSDIRRFAFVPALGITGRL